MPTSRVSSNPRIFSSVIEWLFVGLFVVISLRASAEPAEYIVREPVDRFDDGYRAQVYLRRDQKDYVVSDRDILIPSDTTVIGARFKVLLPYQNLYLYVPNTDGSKTFDWWAEFKSATAAPEILSQLRNEITKAYLARTKESAETDFAVRQLNTHDFKIQIESVTIDPESRALTKLRPIVRKNIESSGLSPASAQYNGFQGDLLHDPLPANSVHFDQVMPPQKGTPSDLLVSQMWIDRRGNYIAFLSSNDSITAAHYTRQHPFYFGQLGKPDLYQFYSKRERFARSKYCYHELHLDVFAGTHEAPDRIVNVDLDRNGNMRVGADGNTVCLKEATINERTLLYNQLRNGSAVLHNMPETRQVVALYKLDGANAYIYVDADHLTRSPESFRLFIGAPGHLEPVPILQVQLRREAGGVVIYTPMGTLYALQNEGPVSRPYWENANGKTPLSAIPRRPFDRLIQTLRQIGVDTNRFREKEFQSPCEYFLRKQPLLRLVS